MADYWFKGLLIGLLFGVPIGVVGTMTVQRTLCQGLRAGLTTGLGASVADCLYACAGVFGLTEISDFLLKYQIGIHLFGGTFVLVLGGIRMFLSSFVVGITNPAAILTFLFAFSYFGISGDATPLQGFMLVSGVFAGTYIWWGALSGMICMIKKKAFVKSFHYRNQIFGTILSLFGIVVFLKVLF